MAIDAYRIVLARVAAAAHRAGRDPGEITVVAVSKEKSIARIRDLYDAGHRDFGENRAGEMSEKISRLPGDIRWHFVGSLQSNKVRQVRSSTHLLHSMDRPSLAKAWLKGSGDPPPVMIQVNVGSEEQKGGVLPGEAGDFASRVAAMGHSVLGLMAIPPLGADAEDSRGFFVAMRELRDAISRDMPRASGLSMGMTNDYEVAIEEGASIIRVGRAIFDTTPDRD